MSNANSLELGMLDLINDERVAAGLEPLRLITTLNDAAETHSSWMLDTDMFSHAGLNGSSPSDRMEAAGYPFEGQSLALENIGWQSVRGAEGVADDVAQVHASLMNSPGHRANILSADAEDIGIGIETGSFTGQNGDYDAVMVTQVFGATAADISAWVDPGTSDVEDDVVAEEDPVEDDTPVEEDELNIDDDPVEEDDLVEEEETDEGETDEDDADDEANEEEDGTNDDEDETPDDPDIVAEDDSDPVEDDPGNDTPEEEAPADESPDCPDDEDVVIEDEPSNEDMGDEPVLDDTETPETPLPFELAEFTVDLRSAFEFTRDGDQLIWETSEDKLVEVFLKAFEDWAGTPAEAEDEDDNADIVDLMIEEAPETTIDMGTDPDEMDEWLFENCA